MRVVLSAHLTANSLSRNFDTFLHEKLAQLFSGQLVGSLDFSLRLLLKFFNLTFSRCRHSLPLRFRFFACLFVNRADVCVQPAQQRVSLGNFGHRPRLLFPGLDQLLLDCPTPRSQSFAYFATENVDCERRKNGEVEKLPKLEAWIVEPLHPLCCGKYGHFCLRLRCFTCQGDAVFANLSTHRPPPPATPTLREPFLLADELCLVER